MADGAKRTTEPTPRPTLCLAIDLKGSTKSGLELTTKKFDRFNLGLVDQLGPHLKAVGLEDALIKFTGDGWLVMSDEHDLVAPLCCLARIMSQRFQFEMAESTGMPIENIPAMRIAVCWGRDLPVTLPNGTRDYVGSSVRRAVRAMQLCEDNEILIDDTVRSWVHQDFETQKIDHEARLRERPDAKMEDEFVLHRLAKLRVESASDPDAPVYFVNTLSIIGLQPVAEDLANRLSDHLLVEAETGGATQTELLHKWNQLLASNLDYPTAREILNDLREAGVQPDVTTFNAILEKATDFRTESQWLQIMTQEGVLPNTETFNILIRKAADSAAAEKRLAKMEASEVAPDVETLNLLIAKAGDYAQANRWRERLARRGVMPDARTFHLLVEQAEDFETAKFWLEAMLQSGIEPEELTFIAVLGKDVTHLSADELLSWYLGLPTHPTHPMQRAISDYRRKGKMKDALRLCLDYPHTQSARKTIRQDPEQSLHYFRSVVDRDRDHANGNYALGIALLELKRDSEAKPWLERALDLAGPGHRRDELERLLHEVDGKR